MASLVHLGRRFFGALSSAAPSATDERWACEHLRPGEHELWRQMSNPDRRHAIGVARRAQLTLGREATRAVVAAALLHDVGKLDSALGTFARAAATVWAGARGRKRVASGRGVVARYLRHDEIGGDLLERAQADGLTTAWARQHHQPETSWTVPAHIGRALKDADDD